jgi:hypothetical protein
MIRPGDDVAVVTAFDDRWLEFVLFDHGDDLRRGWVIFMDLV